LPDFYNQLSQRRFLTAKPNPIRPSNSNASMYCVPSHADGTQCVPYLACHEYPHHRRRFREHALAWKVAQESIEEALGRKPERLPGYGDSRNAS
jgi:hypothetical protein